MLYAKDKLIQRAHIGIFDSGVGGLTVMHQLAKLLPQESLIYFGDTARLPYGGKSRETIIRYSIENTIFLMEKNIKLLVVACNTASAYALDKLRQIFNIPVIGVIEPGAEKASLVTRNQHIAILGTKGTIQSGVYQAHLERLLPQSTLISLACPLFVPLVEESFFQHPATRLVVQEYLKPLQSQSIDTILLGCTHYPLLSHLIQQEVGPHVTLVDSASTCAEKVAYTLKSLQIASDTNQGNQSYFVSDDPFKFQKLAQSLFGDTLENVELKESSS